ncbi:MAG: hypothetical protein KI791_01430 [Cyclobacteriaceae bacterium]|nr:hypothetical protein [Cyclobacteriaceae bacterium SS2]
MVELNNIGLKAEGHIVQKIKGMEKPFVVWDTLAQVNTKNEVEEFIYTILTRTTNILVIVVNAKLITSYFEIIKNFKEDRLIFWSKKSREIYKSICAREFDLENIEDHGDDEDSNIINEEEIEI